MLIRTMAVPVEKCGICLESAQKAHPLVVTPCLHGFHARCFTAWVCVAAKTHATVTGVRVASITCPMCRTLLVFTPMGEGYVLTPAGVDARTTFLTHVRLTSARDQADVKRAWARCAGGGGPPGGVRAVATLKFDGVFACFF